MIPNGPWYYGPHAAGVLRIGSPGAAQWLMLTLTGWPSRRENRPDAGPAGHLHTIFTLPPGGLHGPAVCCP
jgi:hypothetical protein